MTYNFAAILTVYFNKRSYNGTLNHSGMSCDVAEWRDVKRLERALEIGF